MHNDWKEFTEQETARQKASLNLIASENYVSADVLAALGSIFTNKYSEGYGGKRYYAGNEVFDSVEALAIQRAKELFGAEYANVQLLSGSPANQAVYRAFLQKGDKVLALELSHGGHLSHGHPLNFSGQDYNFVFYGVDKDTGRIDMDKVAEIAQREQPKMIVAGFTAYPREVEWKRFREIADSVGAVAFADISHTAGLVAGKQLENPVPYFDVVMTTTHKTLRGPRGAIILAKEQYSKDIDRAVFPGLQGGQHDNVTLAKLVCLAEALRPDFQNYARQVIVNAKVLAKELVTSGVNIISGGTDTHLLLADVTSLGLGGKEAEDRLSQAGIVANKNLTPFDARKPQDPSGLRFGTAALTTRGLKETDMVAVAGFILRALKGESLATEVRQFAEKFNLPGE